MNFEGRRVLVAFLLAASTARAPSAAADSLATAVDTTARRIASRMTPTEAYLPAETTVVAPIAAPVFLGGKQIFMIRARRMGLDPETRVAAIRSRFDLAVADHSTSADSVRLVRTPEGIEVRLGPHFLWMITPADLSTMSVAEGARVVSGLPDLITAGVFRERAGRRPIGVLIAALIALGLTIVAWVLARLVMAGGRRWRAYLATVIPKRLGGIRIGTFVVMSQAQMTAAVIAVLGRIGIVLGILLIYGYVTVVFSLFPWSQTWSWHLLTFARARLIAAAFSVGSAIPQLLVLAVIVLVFYWLVHLSDRFFDAIHNGSVRVRWLHRDVALPTKRLVHVTLWVIAAAIIYPYIPGSQSKSVQGISLLLGVMLSLGSTGIVGNMIAGLVLVYSRSFRIGDRVQLGEHVGDVVQLGFFAIKLRTPRNEEITLPNGQVASQPIVNYTRLALEQGLILHTQVRIRYDIAWRQVHELLIGAASRVADVERDPAPFVFQRALNEHHITYEVCCFTKRSHDQLLLYTRLHEQIQDAFATAGIEILAPFRAALRDESPAPPAGGPEGTTATLAPAGSQVRPAGA